MTKRRALSLDSELINELNKLNEGWRSNQQNGPRAEWVQEQKNRKIVIYIGLYGLIDKTIIRIVKNAKKTYKLCMN